MTAVVNAALPVFALILAGWLAARQRWLPVACADALNRFVVYLALPALLFRAMAQAQLDVVSYGGFIVAFSGGMLLTGVLSFLLGRARGLAQRRLADLSLDALSASYANAGFMGIPLCLMLFGPGSLAPVILTVLMTACVLFGVALALVEFDLQRDGGLAAATRKTLRALLRNPLLVAPILGVACARVGVSLPLAVDNFLALLGGAASPCALVCIGLFLAQPQVKGEAAGVAHSVARTVALKLLVQPGLTALLAFGVFTMPPVWAWCAVICSALPTGTGPFILAQLYQRPAAATSRIILISTLLSVITVPLLISLM